MRKQYTPNFKSNVVLDLFKEDKSLSEAAAEYSVHVNQLRRWRKQAKEGLPDIFNREKQISLAEFKKKEQETHNLYAEIGRLTTELTWLKKKGGC